MLCVLVEIFDFGRIAGRCAGALADPSGPGCAAAAFFRPAGPAGLGVAHGHAFVFDAPPRRPGAHSAGTGLHAGRGIVLGAQRLAVGALTAAWARSGAGRSISFLKDWLQTLEAPNLAERLI